MDAKKIVGLALAYKEHAYKGMYPEKDTEFLLKYFSNHFILDKDNCYRKLLFTKPVKEGIGNGDMTLVCEDELLPLGSYFTKGNSYSITDSETGSDYDDYVIKDCLRSNYLKLDSDDGSISYLYNSRFIARAFYGETHKLWPVTDESAYLGGSEGDTKSWSGTDATTKNENLVNCWTQCYAFYLMRAN